MIEFAIAFRKHRLLGYLAVPYILEKKNGQEFYTIIDVVAPSKTNSYEYNFSPVELSLIKLMDKYCDQSLFKIFSKKESIQAFFNSLEPTFFTSHIAPYLEKILRKCLDILKDSDIKIFHHDTKFLNLYVDNLLTFPANPAEAIFNFIKKDGELKYFLTLKLADKVINLWRRKAYYLINEPCYMIFLNYIIYFEDIDSKKFQPFFEKDYIVIPPSAHKKYFETFILNSIHKYTVNAEGFEINYNTLKPKVLLVFDFDLKSNPCFISHYKYGRNTVLPNSSIKSYVSLENSDENYTFNVYKRDYFWENHLSDYLKGLGLKNPTNGIFKLNESQTTDPDLYYDMVSWINVNKPALTEHDIVLDLSKLQKNIFTDTIILKLKTNNSHDWFDVYGTVQFGDFEFPFLKLRRNILRGIREFELPNGEIAILPKEWFVDYKDFFLFGKENNLRLQFKRYHFGLFNSKVSANMQYVVDYDKLVAHANLQEVKIPAQINATLRPYQSEGVGWLDILRSNSFGGCLADDMGLGKTLQTITVIVKALNDKANTKSENELELQEDVKSSLIVMPLSLISNWENEFNKFAPHLVIKKYLGNERNLNVFEQADVVLSTYGIVRNDFEILQKFQFFYLIMDESQFIKNPASKIYQVVVTLKSHHKLVLTGTPIENSLSDLWAQMNFVNEGILGSQSFFRETFLVPIEKNSDDEKIKKLKKLIQPFILRRTKEAVEKDLPDLTEQILYCEMSDEQKEVYETEKSKVRNLILDTIYSESSQKSGMIILQSLLKLRQAANHPVMIDHDYQFSSGKFEEIIRNIENLIEEDHKVLIFSSFVRHLRLVENHLKDQQIKYSMLTGEIKQEQRAEIINRFQNDPETKLFLISLKAGGYGLNLTSADYVFILDPWWNVASEMQAVSRAHRIGQNKKVFVYRFISNGTIEEKILKLQETKSILVDEFINQNNPFEKLNLQTIQSLLD